MANSPTGHTTVDQNSTEQDSTEQGSMFDDATDTATDAATLEAYESDYELREDSPYEASEDLDDDTLDLFSAHEDEQDEDEHTVIETAEDEAPTSVESPIESPVAVSEPHPEPVPQTVTSESHSASTSGSGPEQPAEPEVAHEANPLPESPAVLTADDFAALEDRIVRAVTLVRTERKARIAAEERAAAFETELQAQIPAIERLQREVDGLRAEREQVRQRIDRLLGQLDALEL